MQTRRSHFHTQRGATLIEALVSLLILSVSLMAATKLQTWLRLNSDLARERSEAVRQAQRDVEQLRAFHDLATFDGMHSQHRDAAFTTTRFQLQRDVHDEEGAKLLHTTVSWPQRGNGEQRVQLASLIARLAPVYSAALALPPQDRVLAARRQLPGAVRSFPDGRTLLRPTSHSRVAWLIDNSTGEITHQCRLASPDAQRDLTVADLGNCEPFEARLLRGHVRFALSSTPDPLDANDVPLTLALQVADVRCETESLTLGTERYLAYACAVPSASSLEPAFVPQGWTIGTTAAAFKSCRYPSAPRAPRNYLVVRGDLECPTALPPHNGAPVVTVQHQP